MNSTAIPATAVAAMTVTDELSAKLSTIHEAVNSENFSELSKVRATFKPHSPLYSFFVLNGFLLNLKFQVEKRDYFLFTIFGVVAMFISHFESFDVRNPHIIVCSPGLKHALNVDYLYFRDLPAYIMRQLEFDQNVYDVLDRYFCSYSMTPIWLKGFITDYIRPMNEKIIQTTMCKLKSQFLKFLRHCDAKYKYKTIFTFNEICKTVANYVIPTMDPFYFSQFYFLTKAYKIKDTKLQHIFNVDYCTGIQCKMLIMMQIIKYTNSPIPESKIFKAMRHDMNKHNIIIQSILQAEQNK